MTADRERLAAALLFAPTAVGEYDVDEVIAVLLPTVARIANERAAAMLRAAADWIWDDVPALASASAELHARADHLDPS